MKLIALLALSIPLFAQQTTPDTVVAGGVFYNQYTTPALSGYAAYAVRLAAGAGTYSYTVVDITSIRPKPFSAQTSTETGVAQYIKTIGKFDVFGIATAGVSVSSGNVGGAFSGGALIVWPSKNGWELQIPVRVIKSSLNAPQYVVGLGIGWGH